MDERTNQIKNVIKQQYRSVREFCKENDLVYTTIDTMLKRDVGKSAFDTVVKVCEILGLCVEALAKGNVLFKQNSEVADGVNVDEKSYLNLYQGATDEAKLVANNVLKSNQKSETEKAKKGA